MKTNNPNKEIDSLISRLRKDGVINISTHFNTKKEYHFFKPDNKPFEIMRHF